MIKDITIGQYLYRDSFVHKLDPRTKILVALIFMIGIFFVENLFEYIFVFLLVLGTALVSRIPIKKLLKGIRPILPLIIITIIMNVIFSKGDVFFSWGFISIGWGGINQAAFMALRIVFLVFFTSLLTLTTSPIDLTNGIEGLLGPFKKVKLPAHEIAMMMSIALRFIPTLVDETDKIMKAQKARGADFETGNIFKRAKSLIPILIPLFVNSFTRADELAQAMEARGYRGDVGRTKYKVLKYHKKDILVLSGFLVVLILLILRSIYL